MLSPKPNIRMDLLTAKALAELICCQLLQPASYPPRLSLRCKLRSSRIKFLQKSVKRNLKSAGSIVSDTVPAISRIRASSDQRSLWLKTINDLSIYFTQSTRKSQNQSKVWMGCIHRNDCRKLVNNLIISIDAGFSAIYNLTRKFAKLQSMALTL